MKYSSLNHIHDFESHDAEFTLISWVNNCLIVSAKHLNIHKDAAPDHEGTDMELSEARITIHDFELKAFISGSATISNVGSSACQMFENILQNTLTVMYIVFENGIYELRAVGTDPSFHVRFTGSSFLVEWNGYAQKAWYEIRRASEI